jgi:hypothetical protein
LGACTRRRSCKHVTTPDPAGRRSRRM